MKRFVYSDKKEKGQRSLVAIFLLKLEIFSTKAPSRKKQTSHYHLLFFLPAFFPSLSLSFSLSFSSSSLAVIALSFRASSIANCTMSRGTGLPVDSPSSPAASPFPPFLLLLPPPLPPFAAAAAAAGFFLPPAAKLENSGLLFRRRSAASAWIAREN